MIKTTSIVIVLILTMLLIYMFPKQAINPGDLMKGHQHLENDCFKCHTVFSGSPGEKCVVCHKPADIGRVTTAGVIIQTKPGQQKTAFHHLLSADTCLTCHPDHKGRDTGRDNRQFSHDLLKGLNINQCSACHRGPADNLHETNRQECSQCHSNTQWRPSTFDHARYFRLDKDHMVACASCHQNNNYKEYTCYGCHDHTPAKIQQEHEKVKIYNYQNCTLCHLSGDKEETKGILQSIKARHASGNNLAGSVYLKPQGNKQASNDPLKGQGIIDCISCHRSPFDNLHQTGNQNCGQCHSTDRWRPASFDHARYFRFDKDHLVACSSCHQNNNYKEYTCYGCHDHTPAKIQQEHEKVKIYSYQNCTLCHLSGDKEETKGILQSIKVRHASGNNLSGNAYLQPGSHKQASNDSLKGQGISNCISCHRSPFDSLHQPGDRNCSQCHSPDQWRPATLDHAQFFRFDGNHRAECQTCHRNNNYKEYTCYGCHEHSPGKIEKEHREEGISNYQNCAACHPSGNEHDIRRSYPAGRTPGQTWTTREGRGDSRQDVNRDSGYNYNDRETDRDNYERHEKEDDDDDDD